MSVYFIQNPIVGTLLPAYHLSGCVLAVLHLLYNVLSSQGPVRVSFL